MDAKQRGRLHASQNPLAPILARGIPKDETGCDPVNLYSFRIHRARSIAHTIKRVPMSYSDKSGVNNKRSRTSDLRTLDSMSFQ